MQSNTAIPADIAVELRGIAKTFGSVVANRNINLSVKKGSIHGIIGENGAGKSTAMKILYGQYRPDGGQIFIHGEARKWRSPQDAVEAGVGMVHQHFMLAGPYTVLDNIILGSEPKKIAPLGTLSPLTRTAAAAKLHSIMSQYSLPVDLDAFIEDLPVGMQQRVEILKLLYRNANILILDEPTAVLTPLEIDALFTNLKKLAAEGKTILIITHKLGEVLAITETVTVFRAGEVTGNVRTAETSAQQLANLMVGRNVVLHVEAPPQKELGAPVVEIKNVTLARTAKAKPFLKDLDLTIRRGEIVGIAGVEGNGQSELIRLLTSPQKFLKSNVSQRLDAKMSVLGFEGNGATTVKLRQSGLAVIPPDRHAQGLLLERNLKENYLLGQQHHKRFSRFGFIQTKNLAAEVERALKEFDVRPALPDAHVGGLSGGNQQKLIIAREFATPPAFLIAAEPTRGVDVGAIEFIHHRLFEARQNGTGILLISSELEEILTLSDRILVMYGGQFNAHFVRGQCDEKTLGVYMGGGKA